MNTNDIHITLPASKSMSNRWLMVNYVMQSTFVLHNLSTADDTQLLLALLSQLRHKSSNMYYCHNAGTPARFMIALLAITPGTHILTGDDRLKQRPMAPLINCLRKMGCQIECTENEGFLPVTITGRTPEFKTATIDPSLSSQFVSGLMLMGPLLPNGITVSLTDRAASRPYIEMTRQILNQAGIEATISPNKRVYRVGLTPPKAFRKSRVIEIERDWSSASYIYSAAAILPGVRLRMQGLSLTSVQGDSVAASIFESMGVTTKQLRSPYRANVRSITVEGSGQHVSRFEYNFIDCPDLLPSVITTCAALGIEARLKGVKNLRLKESDRLMVLKTELEKMGGKMQLTENEIVLHAAELHPTQPVDDHHDHRIAMAFGVLSLKYPNLTVLHPDSVSKSFPDFWLQIDLIKKR